jgi:hypothetical protein
LHHLQTMRIFQPVIPASEQESIMSFLPLGTGRPLLPYQVRDKLRRGDNRIF